MLFSEYTFTKLVRKVQMIYSVLFLYIFSHKVISETLRMANIINGVWRKALKDVEIKGRSFLHTNNFPLQ